MSKKSFIIFIIILILSIAIAIGLPVVAWGFGNSAISDGFPFKWTKFSFLGSESNYTALGIDIVLWFIVVWFSWKLIEKLWRRLHHYRQSR